MNTCILTNDKQRLFQTLWKWLEQGGQAVNAAGNGHNISGNGGSTIAGVVGLNEANLHAIDAKNTATTWRKKHLFLSNMSSGILGIGSYLFKHLSWLSLNN
jgi:hypothetical protein